MHPVSTFAPGPSRRLVFIDVLRAYAILMMLQGHFTDTLLSPAYRDPSLPLYWLWNYMRGMTAPIFFFTTGLIFVFLLLKDGRAPGSNDRLGKGIRRGFFLLGVGYLLKVNLPALLGGYINPWYFSLDVLHCIGLALMALIGVYQLSVRTRVPLILVLLTGGLITFFLDPLLKTVDYSQWPRVLAHFFTREYGSIFTPVPWLGYTLLGGVAGTMLSKRPHWAFSHTLPLLLAVLGYCTTKYSYYAINWLHDFTGWYTFEATMRNNFLLYRLGNVLVVLSIFMWVVPRLPRIPALLPKIGSETLTVYGAHYILLYGTTAGLGLVHLGKGTLDPWTCALGAALFVTLHIVMIAHIETLRGWVYRDIPVWLHQQYRVGRLGFWQFITAETRRTKKLPTFLRHWLF